MFDNRGIGGERKPAGPYSRRLLADDAKALVDHLGITGFHLLGVSMGGMIAQEYALAYPGDLQSRSPWPAPTPRRGRSARGCSPCGRTRPRCSASRSSCGTSRCGRSPPVLQRAARMSWPSSRPRCGTWTSRSTPTWPSSPSSSSTTPRPGSATSRCRPWCSPASEDILIPVSLSRRTARGHPRLGVGRPSAVAMPASGSTPPASTAPLPISSAATERDYAARPGPRRAAPSTAA